VSCKAEPTEAAEEAGGERSISRALLEFGAASESNARIVGNIFDICAATRLRARLAHCCSAFHCTPHIVLTRSLSLFTERPDVALEAVCTTMLAGLLLSYGIGVHPQLRSWGFWLCLILPGTTLLLNPSIGLRQPKETCWSESHFLFWQGSWLPPSASPDCLYGALPPSLPYASILAHTLLKFTTQAGQAERGEKKSRTRRRRRRRRHGVPESRQRQRSP